VMAPSLERALIAATFALGVALPAMIRLAL
jgi:hypothetical protein